VAGVHFVQDQSLPIQIIELAALIGAANAFANAVRTRTADQSARCASGGHDRVQSVPPAAALFVDQTNRAAQMAFHRDYPFAVNSSPKAVKAQAYGWLNAIHYLAPADTSGVNICPKASAGCKALCLGWFSGQAGIGDDNGTRKSRLDKTRRFMRDRKTYLADIVRQIER
jgi:hypothetical protein